MNSQADPFSSFRLNKNKPEPIQSSPDDSQDPLNAYRIKKSEDDSDFLSNIPRHAARIGSRVAETIGGIPGDIQELIRSGVFSGIEKLTGKPLTAEQEKKSRAGKIIPSSSEIKQFSEEASKGYTKAKNTQEELADEYATTVASLLGPMKFRKALGVAALGMGAKKGVESLGFGEGTQEATKLGTMLISSMFNPKGVKKLYTNYYNESLRHAPEGTLVSAKPLEHKLNSLKKKLSSGIEAPTEKAVLDDLEKVLEKVKNGKVDVREMMATNRSINERMGDPTLLIRGKNLYPELKKAVNDSIKLYKNPEFIKNWRSANEAFAGFSQSQKLSRYITRHIGNKPLQHVLLGTFAEAAAGHPEAILPTIAASGGAFLGIKGIELGQRIFSNPTLRKYYGEVLLHAAKEDSVAMMKSAKKLEKALEKE